MGMQVGDRKGGPMADINVTPLIDVVLVLLVVLRLCLRFWAVILYELRGFTD